MALFLASTVAFGLLTYAIVGGTRANIIIAFSLFLFIGIIRGWITLWMLAAAGRSVLSACSGWRCAAITPDVSGAEALYTFLYLTRDTFSPGKTGAIVAKLRQHPFSGPGADSA